MFGTRGWFSGTAHLMALFPVRTNRRWRPPPSWKNFKWPYLRTGRPIQFMFGPRMGFTGTADLMALSPVRTNSRWQPPPSWKNFKWSCLSNRSSDALHVWFQYGVFGDGGSNDEQIQMDKQITGLL